MHGVTLAVSAPAARLPAIRRAAMETAHAIATELAEAGGAGVGEVGEVMKIDESSGYQVPVAVIAETRMTRATPVEAGEQQLRIDVDVTYRLIDADRPTRRARAVVSESVEKFSKRSGCGRRSSLTAWRGQ